MFAERGGALANTLSLPRARYPSRTRFRKLKKQLERLCNSAAGRELPDCRDPSLFGGPAPAPVTPPPPPPLPTDDFSWNASVATTTTPTTASPLDALCSSAVDEILSAGGNVTQGTLAAAGCNTTVFNGE